MFGQEGRAEFITKQFSEPNPPRLCKQQFFMEMVIIKLFEVQKSRKFFGNFWKYVLVEMQNIVFGETRSISHKYRYFIYC